MRRGLLWPLILLCLPGFAFAEGTSSPVVEQGPSDHGPAIERADTPASPSPPALDLRIDPTQLPSGQAVPAGPRAFQSDKAQLGAGQDATDRGLSFSVELKPRSRFGSLARDSAPDTSGLEDDLERLIEKGALGVRGRYRF